MDKIKMGEGSYGFIKTIGDGEVKIGKYTSIAGNVSVVCVGHNTDFVTTYPFTSRQFRGNWKGAKSITGHPVKYGTTKIGNDCWIGQGVTILGGSEIKDGAVIGAGSVVRGIVDPYTISIGNPNIVVALRFAPRFISELLEIKWWDWNKEKIEEALPLLCSKNIEEFIRRYSK